MDEFPGVTFGLYIQQVRHLTGSHRTGFFTRTFYTVDGGNGYQRRLRLKSAPWLDVLIRFTRPARLDVVRCPG